jgi:hypothetical protein
VDVRKLLLVAGALTAAAGCAIEEEDFPEAYGSAWCSKYRQCERADYEADYDDKDECDADAAEVMDVVSDAADLFGGEYDAEVARECVNAVRGASCEEWQDGDFGGNCDDVWQ